MHIDWLEYEEASSQRKIERVSLAPLTLLVGRSAAGKTEILRVLSFFLAVVTHEYPITVDCRFAMGFRIGDTSYVWEIASAKPTTMDSGETAYPITSERLDSVDQTGQLQHVFQRTVDTLNIQAYDKLPAISAYKSVLSTYRTTEPLKNIVNHFAAVSSLSRQMNAYRMISTQLLQNVQEILRGAQKQSQLLRPQVFRTSEWPIALDIYIARHAMPGLFKRFLADVQAIFPEIDDIDMGTAEFDSAKYMLTVRQDGRYIVQTGISSGMLRTIFILATLHFRAEGSIMLFDELENSLGVNCLDEVVERIQMQVADGETQFVLTSHHPYIINQIPVENWLLVEQHHGVITTKKPETVGIGTGYREQFFELMNYMKRD